MDVVILTNLKLKGADKLREKNIPNFSFITKTGEKQEKIERMKKFLIFILIIEIKCERLMIIDEDKTRVSKDM